MPDKDIWIYRFDGTVQCDDSAKEIPLEKMRKNLELLIGEANVLDSEKRNVPVPRVCGYPTGACNAYKITAEGWYILNHGFVGNPGYKLWPEQQFTCCDPEENGYGPIPLSFLAMSVESMPTRICDLLGKVARVYNAGDPLTDDWNPERVNIELSDQRRIARIWFG